MLATLRRLAPSCLNGPASPRLREAEVDLRRGRIRPARRDDLAARVEVDPLRPVDVAVAEERRLPPPERVGRDPHPDRHVDADHARLHVELELAGDPPPAPAKTPAPSPPDVGY